MFNIDSLKPIHYVIDQEGRKSAIQVDLNTWIELMQYMEDLEDRAVVKEKLDHLCKGPEESEAVSWTESRHEW